MSARKEGPYRLPGGGQIDREQTIPFRFNGRSYVGYGGDSLASALLANGVRTVARSFKFHRPRGIFSCGVEEPNALLQLGHAERSVPSARATLVGLTRDLEARSQSGWPSVTFDVGRVLDGLAPLWAAGFYNKTFIWPSWHTYEPVIRRLAGLGQAPTDADPDRYEVGNLHCDVLIVGGGVAGLKAALEAGRSGARVVLAHQDAQFGGDAVWNGGMIDGTPASVWLSQTIEQLKRFADVQLQPRTMAIGYYDRNVVTLHEGPLPLARGRPRERLWVVRAERVLLASGAIEQPMIFANNDRPGIILASAARQYLRRYSIAAGSRMLIATNNDSAYALARDLKEAGVTVLGIADSRPQVPYSMRSVMRALSIDLFPGSIPIDTQGFGALRGATLGELAADGSRVTAKRTFRCDALATSGGFSPTLHLFAQAGGKLIYDGACGSLQPVTSHPSITILGAAAEKVPIGPRVSPVGDPGRKWVDLLHDVTVADLDLALREGFTSVEHIKRYTTVGMAADQGKTSTAGMLEVLGQLRGVPPCELGHTTFRPPFTPVSMGAIAGRDIGARFAPHRILPMHEWHIAHCALMQDFGEWRRPVAYLRDRETREQAIRRESLGVRTSAGLYDGSSLGKIEIQGPDALEFLDRFYINDLTTLQPYRARYGLMLRELGTIFDDGTVVMLAPDCLLITTTSGQAGHVEEWLEEWHQCEWPHLRVVIMSVTEAWATITLAGPRARDILAKVPSTLDLSNTAFPHLAMREGTLCGAQTRVYRVSFTGELTYEINVPAACAQRVWDELLRSGAAENIQPFGLDALMSMRLEKGFLHLGTDTDGTSVPDDVGWGKVAAKKRRDYIGRRSLALPNNIKADRLQLIGLTAEPGKSLVIGSHLRSRHSAHPTDGWISSAGRMTFTDEPIALAMLRSGRSQIGDEVDIYDAGSLVGRARVVNPPFFDPTGDRLNG